MAFDWLHDLIGKESSLYTIGRIIASFVQRALNMQQLGLAVRYRADMSTIQSSKSLVFDGPIAKLMMCVCSP